MTHGLARRILRDHLRCVSGAFTGAFESNLAGAGPPDHLPAQIGDCDYGIIERRKNVCDSSVNVFTAFDLDDFRLFNFIGVERQVLWRFSGWFLFLGGFGRFSRGFGRRGLTEIGREPPRGGVRAARAAGEPGLGAEQERWGRRCGRRKQQ